MNTERKQQLNAWIAEKVMGWKILPSGNWKDGNNPYNYPCEFNPVENYGDAMMVLEKCLAKERDGVYGYDVDIVNNGGRFNISCYKQLQIEEEADTLTLAICLFAEKLFTETH